MTEGNGRTAKDARAAGRPAGWWVPLALALVVAGAASTLSAIGRPPICTCGFVKLWEGNPNGPGNSQHLLDWYTPSHLIHGFIFFALAHLALRRQPLRLRFLAAVLVEAAWEIAENSPLVIDRYRTATAAAGYVGDSVLNSMSDLAAMGLGFWLAGRLPVPVTVGLALALELWTGVAIRDNLALNVLMLLHPLDAVRAWQSGA